MRTAFGLDILVVIGPVSRLTSIVGIVSNEVRSVDSKLFSGGAIERWEDPDFRGCFTDILEGNWRLHDPYDLGGRLKARRTTYGRSDKVCCCAFSPWYALNLLICLV